MINFKRILEDNPIVAAVKDMEQLNKALEADVDVIFVLFGNIMDIIEISHKISEKNKIGILHIDLVDGLTNREIVLEYLKEKDQKRNPLLPKIPVLMHLLFFFLFLPYFQPT